MDLCSRLQMALLQHQVRLKPVPLESFHQASKLALEVSDDSRLRFLQDILDQEDEDELDSDEKRCQVVSSKLWNELVEIVSNSSSCPSSTSISSVSRGPLVSLVSREYPAAHFESLLLACAKAVAASDSGRAHELVEELKALTLSKESSLHRTALYFTNALVARLRGYGAQMHQSMAKEMTKKQSIAVQMNLPTLRATELFANQTIFNACRGAKNIHIVDYGIFYGCQWPSLLRALSEREEGPPAKMMITGIELSSVAPVMHQTGDRLVSYAKSCGIALEFQPVVSDSWERAEPRYNVSHDETLIINCKLRLKHLKEDGPENPRRAFFSNIAKLRPNLFVQCVVNMDLSSPFFIHRFQAAWKDLHVRMEQIEETMKIDPSRLEYLNKFMENKIMNIIACEGGDRIERSASYRTWNLLTSRAGFEKVEISEDALRIVKGVWSSHDKFTYGTDEKWLLLGWKDVTLTAMSAWQPIKFAKYL